MMQLIILLLLPFLFTGLINKLKAILVGKQGASIFQQYYDFIKLIQKGEVISNTTSFIFKIAPTINLSCTIVAAIILTLFHFEGDFILFAYLLALGKFLSVLAAMDTGFVTSSSVSLGMPSMMSRDLFAARITSVYLLSALSLILLIDGYNIIAPPCS